jgi:hypothetical protein
MKKGQTPNDQPESSDELAPEYEFDYAQASPNRFANAMSSDIHVILLDPDVAAAFPTTESVNTALRRLMTTTPRPTTS